MNKFSKYLSNPEILSLFGERMREWRVKKNFAQKDLVKLTGLSRGAIQRLETGENVDLNTLVPVLRVLDLIDNLNLFLPEPEPDIENLKSLTRISQQRQRVRKKK